MRITKLSPTPNSRSWKHTHASAEDYISDKILVTNLILEASKRLGLPVTTIGQRAAGRPTLYAQLTAGENPSGALLLSAKAWLRP